MLQNYQIQVQAAILQAEWSHGAGREIRALNMAHRLYGRMRRAACLRRLRSTLTGRAHCLLDLHEVEHLCTIRGRHYGGMQTVPLARIRGSADRCRDFDDQFRPLQCRNESRWLSIAIAQQMGVPLPPVALIQVGDLYFVHDGHHRVSVARAMGQHEIDAEVVVWEVAGPLPWAEAPRRRVAGTWHVQWS
jgi:hypothetical protein